MDDFDPYNQAKQEKTEQKMPLIPQDPEYVGIVISIVHEDPQNNVVYKFNRTTNGLMCFPDLDFNESPKFKMEFQAERGVDGVIYTKLVYPFPVNLETLCPAISSEQLEMMAKNYLNEVRRRRFQEAEERHQKIVDFLSSYSAKDVNMALSKLEHARVKEVNDDPC